MELKEIQNLIKFVAKSGASEVKLETGDVKITIRTGSDTTIVQQAPVAVPTSAPTVIAATPAATPAPAEAPAEATPAAPAVAAGWACPVCNWSGLFGLFFL